MERMETFFLAIKRYFSEERLAETTPQSFFLPNDLESLCFKPPIQIYQLFRNPFSIESLQRPAILSSHEHINAFLLTSYRNVLKTTISGGNLQEFIFMRTN